MHHKIQCNTNNISLKGKVQIEAKVYIKAKLTNMFITTSLGACLFDSFVWRINVTYRQAMKKFWFVFCGWKSMSSILIQILEIPDCLGFLFVTANDHQFQIYSRSCDCYCSESNATCFRLSLYRPGFETIASKIGVFDPEEPKS